MISEHRELEARYNRLIADQFRAMINGIATVLEKKELKDPLTGRLLGADKDDKAVLEQAHTFRLDQLDIRSPERLTQCADLYEDASRDHPASPR